MKSTQFSVSHFFGPLEAVVVAGKGMEVGLCKDEYPPQVISFSIAKNSSGNFGSKEKIEFIYQNRCLQCNEECIN